MRTLLQALLATFLVVAIVQFVEKKPDIPQNDPGSAESSPKRQNISVYVSDVGEFLFQDCRMHGSQLQCNITIIPEYSGWMSFTSIEVVTSDGGKPAIDSLHVLGRTVQVGEFAIKFPVYRGIPLSFSLLFNDVDPETETLSRLVLSGYLNRKWFRPAARDLVVAPSDS